MNLVRKPGLCLFRLDLSIVDSMFLNQASRIILAVPARVDSLDKYYGLIGPQLWALLVQSHNAKLSQAAAILLLRMFDKNFAAAYSAVIVPRLSELIQLGKNLSEAKDVSEHTPILRRCGLDDCLRGLARLFDVENAPRGRLFDAVDSFVEPLLWIIGMLAPSLEARKSAIEVTSRVFVKADFDFLRKKLLKILEPRFGISLETISTSSWDQGQNSANRVSLARSLSQPSVKKLPYQP